MIRWHQSCAERERDLRYEIARYRGLLARYGRHIEGCQAAADPCVCGYRAALVEAAMAFLSEDGGSP